MNHKRLYQGREDDQLTSLPELPSGLKNLNCSILIKDNRNQNFVKSILDLAQNKDLQRILGQNGLEIIEKYYTQEIIINKYLNLFSEL